MSERFQVWLQHALPKRALTEFMGGLARRELGSLTTAMIDRFVRRYGVNMAEAADPDVRNYASFNDFFTRPLMAGVRPLAQADYLCPVDGAISQFGRIEAGQIFQAKGHHYSAQALLGGSAELAALYDGGHFACLYLSPRDYHRIHMPCAGRLTHMVYVPGDLYSVNPLTARHVPGLFARNERVVCVFQGLRGPFAMVLVGATIVGSMATAWHGVVNPPRLPAVHTWIYDDKPETQALHFKPGDEMGRFLLGSTVVMLFPQSANLTFNPLWQPGGAVRLGEAMAQQETPA